MPFFYLGLTLVISLFLAATIFDWIWRTTFLHGTHETASTQLWVVEGFLTICLITAIASFLAIIIKIVRAISKRGHRPPQDGES